MAGPGKPLDRRVIRDRRMIHVHDRTGRLIAAPAIDRDLHTFRYRWWHTPTGTEGVSENLFLNYDAFVTCIERWNAQDANWHYEIVR